MPAPSALLARVGMLLASVIWGVTFVVVHRALADLPVFHLLTFRFALGALLLLPLLRRSGRAASLGRDGALVGLALFAGYAFQTSGLLWTTPSRSAFLTGLAILFVPLLGRLVRGRPAGARVWVGAALAVAGVYALYRPGWESVPFGLGDALTVLCAVCFAAHVMLVEWTVRRNAVAPLAVVQFAVVALLASPSLLLRPPARAEFTPAALTAIAITGALATALAFLLQLYAQRRLSASETGVFLALEPVSATLYSVASGVEPWGLATGLGGALVVSGVLIVQLGPPPRDAGVKLPPGGSFQ